MEGEAFDLGSRTLLHARWQYTRSSFFPAYGSTNLDFFSLKQFAPKGNYPSKFQLRFGGVREHTNKHTNSLTH